MGFWQHYGQARHYGIPRRFAICIAWQACRGPSPALKAARGKYLSAMRDREARMRDEQIAGTEAR